MLLSLKDRNIDEYVLYSGARIRKGELDSTEFCCATIMPKWYEFAQLILISSFPVSVLGAIPWSFRHSFMYQCSVDLPNIQGIHGQEGIEKSLPVYQSQ